MTKTLPFVARLLSLNWRRLTIDPRKKTMYQRPRFLEELHAIREEMSRECDYDLDLFAELVRSGKTPERGAARNIRGVRQYAPPSPIALKRLAKKKERRI